MSELNTQTPAKPSVTAFMERIAMPFLIFSAVLLVLLLISALFVLPRFTEFTVANVTLSPSEMVAYTNKLKAELVKTEETRNHLALPLQNDQYTAAKEHRNAMPDAMEIRSQLREAAAKTLHSQGTLTFSNLAIDAS